MSIYRDLDKNKLNSIPKHELIERDGFYETIGFNIYTKEIVIRLIKADRERMRKELQKRLHKYEKNEESKYICKNCEIIDEVLGEKN